MTKTRIREVRAASKANSAHTAIIAELLDCITELQSRTRRGEDISQAAEELPLAAKVNPAKKARGTQAEMEAFVEELGLPKDDGEYFFHKMEATEWKVGGKPIKDWRAQVRSWKAGKFFPSQKANGTGNGQHGAPARSVGPARCNL